MKNYTKYPKGSLWRKWDLHIHTPMSIVQQYGGNNDTVWNRFVQSLETIDPNTKVIGINDYYFIDGYEKVMEYKKNGRLSNIEKVFPILEFRIDTFSGASDNKFNKINLHVLFDIDENNLQSEIKAIRNEFIGNINLSKSLPTKKLTIENLASESSDKTLQSGFSELIPNTQQVIELAKSEQWKNKVFLILGYKEWNDLDRNNQLKPNKTDLYKLAQAFFTASPNDDMTKKEEVLGFMAKGSPIKPLLHSMDIHGFNLLSKENYKCFTWIKSDPTFNGLKQIIYERESRVKIQSDHPEEKTSYSVIDAVRFLDRRQEKNFSDEWINLNPNLNAIIGGKSSGKSLLLYHIAKSIDPEYIDILNKESNVSHKLGYTFENDPKWDFEVKWADNEVSRLKDASRPHKPISYIPQLYLNRLAEDQKEELNKLVDSMLMDSDENYRILRERQSRKIKELSSSLLLGIDKVFSAKSELKKKEKELKQLNDESAIKKNIKSLEGKIEILRKASKFSSADESKYNDLLSKKEEQEEQHENQDQLIKILSGAKDALLVYSDEFEEILSEHVYSHVEEMDIPEEENRAILDTILASIASKVKQVITSETEKQFARIKKDRVDLKSIKATLTKILNSLKPLEQKIVNAKEFEKIQKSKSKEEKILQTIKTKKKEIAKEKERISLDKSFEDYVKTFDVYKNILQENDRYRIIPDTNNLELRSGIKFDELGFDSNFVQKINKKRSLDNVFPGMFNDNKYIFNPGKHIENISIILKKIDASEIQLNAGFDEKSAVQALLGDYFSIDYNLIQDGDDLLMMSPGKRGIILFQLFLHLSKSSDPILLDQPEDNLDNRTVYQELNEFIKSKKIQRQIIIVSHNPNLVVSTDAENVIVANQDGQNRSGSNKDYRFEYVTGSLEHSFSNSKEQGILFQRGIQQHVCDILEGGREAFTKRESKYSFE